MTTYTCQESVLIKGNALATQTLERIWPLNRIDASERSILTLSLLLFPICTVLGGLTYLPVADEPMPRVFVEVFGADSIFIGFCFNGFQIALHTFGALYLARTFEKDMAMLPADILQGAQRTLMQPTTKTLAVSYAGYLTVMLFVSSASFVMLIEDRDFWNSLLEYADTGWVGVVFLPIAVVLVGMIASVWIAIIWHQRSFLLHLVDRVQIDLMRVDGLAPLTNPGLRLTTLFLIVFTIVPAGWILLDEKMETFWTTFVAGVIPVLLILVAMLVEPVLKLRNKIREVKQRELESLLPSLDEKSAAEESVSSRDPAMLVRLQFIESRPELPMTVAVQRLILLGIITPLTWVLAAVVENMLYQ